LRSSKGVASRPEDSPLVVGVRAGHLLRRPYWGLKWPGFQSRGPGAREKWDDLANQMLFADVMSVVVKQKRPSEHAAVKHIVSKPTKFLNRYSKYKFQTLYRQFMRAKRQFEQNDRALRDEGDDPTDRWGRIMSRDDVIRREIDLCSAEAYRKRRPHAQKSATPKNA